MNDGKIYITISDKRGTGDGVIPEAPEQQKQKKEQPSQWNYFKDSFVRFAEQQAMQAINYTVSNIGNFTGNYLAQQNTQAAVSAIKQAVGIVSAFAVNPIAGAIAVASTAINFGYSEYTANYNNRKQNREIAILRERSGLDTLTNGSR